MDFQLSKTHKLLQQMLRQFAEKELKPRAAEYDQIREYPWDHFEKFFDLGFMAFHLPVEEGGSGGDMLGYALTMETFASVDTPTTSALSGHNEAGVGTLRHWGTEQQKEKYLPQLIGQTARKIGGFCLSEPQAGSDTNGIQTRAVLEDDHYVLNGSKCWVTNGGTAEIFTLMAVTDPTIKGGKGKSAFIFEKNLPGVTVGKKENMMGFGNSYVTEFVLDNVKIPKENLLGQEGDGLKIALGGLEGGRTTVAGEAVGNAHGTLRLAKKFANTTKAGGKLLAESQYVQFKLAELQTQADAAQLLLYRAASMIDNGLPCNLESTQAKYFCSKTANDIAKEVVQLFGQFGYTDEYRVEAFMRDAKLLEIFEGTSEVQKIVISREMGLKTRGDRKPKTTAK